MWHDRYGQAAHRRICFSISRASRYPPSRYDGDSRRSRSRDRSPDRRSLYSDGGPRRSSNESRSNNSAAFQSNRDAFRDIPRDIPRDTPRGPKALLDPPSGPRGGYSGDFRGRGRGRGRGWRDDSRDRGRDRDIDFRDRRDPPYRDDRSRERDRGDWRDRDRDSFRGRRPSPRGRSPIGRDFRDARDLRDAPLGVDADRARRGSRDGPLSAGSSSSDPPFGPSSYRGGYGGRGRGRGRGDWDRGRGRPFYDDRDRYGPPPRARSQEGRYRDRDDRDRERDNRYFDADTRSRDPRDDRDIRDRENRPKSERTSHEPPPAKKDVSPPPVAPAAPSFGSVPNRTASSVDIGSAIGKTPPTGPRALKEDRPAPPTPSPIMENRLPPTGPSNKPPCPEGSPPIPSGPRAQRTGPSSKQWINPALKSRAPESPKPNRSQSTTQSQSAGYHSGSAQPERQTDLDKRPRSSDSKADSQHPTANGTLRGPHPTDSGPESSRTERRPRSVGSPFDKSRKEAIPSPVKIENAGDNPAENAAAVRHHIDKDAEADQGIATSVDETDTKQQQSHTIKIPVIRISSTKKEPNTPPLDQSSESDDDEEFGEVIESGIHDVEAQLRELEGDGDSIPIDPITRYVVFSLDSITGILKDRERLAAMVGRIPDIPDPSEEARIAPKPQSAEPPKDKPVAPEVEKEHNPKRDVVSVVPVLEPSSNPTVIPASEPTGPAEPAQSSSTVDETYTKEPPSKTPPTDEKPDVDGDVVMEDVPEARETGAVALPPTIEPNGISPTPRQTPPENEAHPSKRESGAGSSPPSVEDDDDTEIEDVDLQRIDIVRTHGATPPIDTLPDFDEKPWYEDDNFVKSMDTPQLELKSFILNKLKGETEALLAEQTQSRKIYAGNYEEYLRFTMSDDPLAVKSREKFSCLPSMMDANGQKPGLNAESKPESTSRRSRYASERDLERILEESRRVEDEKRERQLRAEKEKYRTEKEAVLPDQYQTEQEMEGDFYTDVTGFVQPEKIVAAWEVLPPVDNFTGEEYAIFEKAYLEFPKQWGRVSDPLPNRDFGTSIQFYYLKKEKEELNLKEKLKKRPRQRKKGRGKQRSSALVSELGNVDNENEEGQEAGEGGERRRPRRAAAPTFNSEATPATDGEATPAGTPGRRGGAKTEAGAEKPERKRRGRQAAKDKEPKQPRATPTLAAAPPASTKGSRSRSSSRAQGPPEWAPPQQPPNEVPRLSAHPELAPSSVPMPPATMQTSFPQTQSVVSPERMPTSGPPTSIVDVMAPPPLRPDPLHPPSVAMLDLNQAGSSDRKSGTQPSSYWSVPEATEFPLLLRSFGSDWAAIATHMRTKTAVMVSAWSPVTNYLFVLTITLGQELLRA